MQKDLKRAQESGDFSLRRDLTTVKSALMEAETKGNASEVAVSHGLTQLCYSEHFPAVDWAAVRIRGFWVGDSHMPEREQEFVVRS